VSEQQKIGFLKLLGDVLKNLGSRLVSRWDTLVGATISLMSHAQARISSTNQVNNPLEEEHNDEGEDMDDGGSLKSVRM